MILNFLFRPLTKEMINYARQDTHFLLYLYDVMKNQLIDSGNQFSNLLISVFDQSKALCEKVRCYILFPVTLESVAVAEYNLRMM